MLASSDATGGDAIYTQGLGLVPTSLPALEQDCIMRQTGRLPIVTASGTAIQVRVTARDRAGHLATWPDTPVGVVTPGSYLCSGDACGCCLLTSSDPVTECHGLPGMISPDFPSGVCLSF
jgi:hypothetical protein